MCNKKNDEYALLENFIFDDNVQNTLQEIKNNVIDFNILEIIGMGSQEIKHSNILAWLFSDLEHNLEYKVLENFLKKVIEANELDTNTNLLKHYIYLPKKKKDITIYREKDNIDLLLVDKANKVVIAIENKIYANERIEGDDGGQLNKYLKTVNQKYSEFKNKYFIYLTIDKSLPSEQNNQNIWLCATHKMIGDVIEGLIESQNLLPKVEMILTSYVDLLKRRNIMEDKNLEELCKRIWEKNAKELEILFRYKTTKIDKLLDLIKPHFRFYQEETLYLKLDIIDKIYQHIYSKEWLECENYAIDISIYSPSTFIWIGYSQPEINENESLQKLYTDIFKSKVQKSKQIIMIRENDIEDFNDEDLQNKANEIVEVVKKEIEKFEELGNKALNY